MCNLFAKGFPSTETWTAENRVSAIEHLFW
jgi:hypothetical protein